MRKDADASKVRYFDIKAKYRVHGLYLGPVYVCVCLTLFQRTAFDRDTQVRSTREHKKSKRRRGRGERVKKKY